MPRISEQEGWLCQLAFLQTWGNEALGWGGAGPGSPSRLGLGIRSPGSELHDFPQIPTVLNWVCIFSIAHP